MVPGIVPQLDKCLPFDHINPPASYINPQCTSGASEWHVIWTALRRIELRIGGKRAVDFKRCVKLRGVLHLDSLPFVFDLARQYRS
jgi:hypothetical protein